MVNSLLFVCVGNVCRSPMAEGFFREQFKKNSRDIRVSSAGLCALVDRPAVFEAEQTMLDIGVDISSHRAKKITIDMVVNADLILVMENKHKLDLSSSFPFSRGKIHLLGRWGGFQIGDPYLLPKGAFIEVLKLIEHSWHDWQHRF